MLERTQIFVDASYLLASFYNSWDTGARSQLEIDLPEVVSVLGRMAQDQLKQPVHRQFWYDGIPDSGPHRYQRSLRSEPGVQLRAGQLIEWGDRRTQKAVDTRLVADMVVAAVRGNLSDIVLVSGDADMLPGVEEAVNAGIRVHLYGFGWDSMSSQLRFACDTTTILDPREDFRDTMRLQILEGPLPANAPTTPLPGETIGEDTPDPQFKPLGDTEEPEESGPSPIPAGISDANRPKPASPKPTVPKSTSSSPNSKADTTSGKGDAKEDTAQAPGLSAPAAAVSKVEDKSGSAGATAQSGTAQSAAAQPAAKPNAAAAEPNVSDQAVTPMDLAAKSQETTTDSSRESGGAGLASEKKTEAPKPKPNPSMMARHRKLRSRYVPLPNEVWASAGEQNPYDIGQQYAIWWFDHAATESQKDDAHLLSGGGLPPEIDRPLLQFACETLHEYTLTETQRVGLRDGFHSGIRGIMLRGPID